MLKPCFCVANAVLAYLDDGFARDLATRQIRQCTRNALQSLVTCKDRWPDFATFNEWPELTPKPLLLFWMSTEAFPISLNHISIRVMN